MRKAIPAADYTRRGDPLKIDCGYTPNGTVKLFHALALAVDVNAAKILSFTFPALAEGIRQKESKQAHLTAVVEDDLPGDDDHIGFALETLARYEITVRPLAQMPSLAATAAREMLT
jgi:hypothetical protein